MISLNAGDSRLDLDPNLGGAMRRWLHLGADVMRATPEGASDVLETACFPLVPFANRIRNGQFVFEGHKVKMAPNLGDHPHTLHGQGWRARWQVTEQNATRAVFTYHHAPGEWPWEYEAQLAYELRDGGVRAFLSCRNLSPNHMPAGLGFHPHFNRHPASRLKAAVDGVWISDDQTLPRNWHAGVLKKDWTHGDVVAHETLIDNAYTGYHGPAELYEGDNLTHVMRASPDCRWLHIYVPTGENFFCVQPVNHMPDPFNQPNSGLKILKSGEASMVWMDISLNP